MVEIVDGGAHDLLEELEVEQHPGFVELCADKGDEDLVVVAVRVLALAAIVAEVVAGGEPGFYGDFKHDSVNPFGVAMVARLGAEWARMCSSLLDCTFCGDQAGG